MLVLADSSVWVDHLRRAEPELVRLLEAERLATHSAVIGELACGSLRERAVFLDCLQRLPTLVEAQPEEVLHLVQANRLWGRGLGWVDVLLLASCRLASARLWTRDRRLADAAQALGLVHLV